MELILTWFKNCVLISKATREANYGADPVVRKINNLENAIFQLLFCQKKKKNDAKLLEQLKTGFKRSMKWNEYR